MRDESARGLVLARSLALAVPSVALSGLAHALGGGTAPAGTLVGLGALQLAVATRVATRPLGAARVAVWAVGSQLTTHVALAWLHASGGTVVTVAGHHGVEHAHAALGHAHALVPPGPARWTMLTAHLLGTLAVVALVAGIDRAAAAVRSRWSVLLHALSGHPVPAVPRGLVPAAPRAEQAARPLRHTVVRRGPPVVVPA